MTMQRRFAFLHEKKHLNEALGISVERVTEINDALLAIKQKIQQRTEKMPLSEAMEDALNAVVPNRVEAMFMGLVMEEQFNCRDKCPVTRNDGAKKYEAPQKATQEIRISLSRLDALLIVAWIVFFAVFTTVNLLK